MKFKEIAPESWEESAFRLIGKDWLLLLTGEKEHPNLMTASWGGFGILWNRPVVYLWVRPERYTYGLLQREPCFSVNILPEQYREVYRLCGTISGRDTDKLARAGLTLCAAGGAPYLAESRMVMQCCLCYRQPMQAEGYLRPDLLESLRSGGSLHTLFIAEITGVLQKTE